MPVLSYAGTVLTITTAITQPLKAIQSGVVVSISKWWISSWVFRKEWNMLRFATIRLKWKTVFTCIVNVVYKCSKLFVLIFIQWLHCIYSYSYTPKLIHRESSSWHYWSYTSNEFFCWFSYLLWLDLESRWTSLWYDSKPWCNTTLS